MNLDVTKQESSRLRGQAESLQRNLDETRAILDEERRRSQQVSASPSAPHSELLQQINELNLLRESNTTLRDEAGRRLAAINELQQKIKKLEQEHEPLHQTLSQQAAEIDINAQARQGLEEENRRWKQRVQQLLDRHERIDPEAHTKALNDLTDAKAQVAQLQHELEVRDSKHQQINAEHLKDVDNLVCKNEGR